MNKERLLAARQKLKEYQRQKLEKSRENISGLDDPQNCSNDQGNSSIDHEIQRPESLTEKRENIGNYNEYEIRSTASESPHFFTKENHVNNTSTPTQSVYTPVQKEYHDHESTNGGSDNQSFSFIPSHSRNESSSTTSSQIVHENLDQNSHVQNSHRQSIENLIPQSKLLNSNSSSLQKEHLLQMASAVAHVLENEQGLDQSTLNNCDLEQRNQFLSTCLEEQKKLVNQLHIQVSQSNSRIAELEAILKTKNTEFEGRLMQEINPLREQIQVDAQTIGILVGEKEELTAANAQCQAIINQKTDEVGDLYGKLKNALQRVSELERDLTTMKNNMDEFSETYGQFQKNYQEIVEVSAKLKKQTEEYELETSELRQKLNYKNMELVQLQQEIQEKIALLSLSELRVQQMSNSSQEMNSLETQHHTTKMLEQQLARMKEAFENVSGEKDEVSKKFQSYVQQLEERRSNMQTELEAAKKVIEESEIRQQGYIQRLSELEQQIQKEKEKPVTPVTEENSEKVEILTKTVDNLVLEQENLQSLVNEKDKEIETMREELKELQEIREQSIEATKLVSALQSEQLGASRAVSQNQQLKIQLNEMHDAFIALSNAKLDLTEQLQAERAIGKKLNTEFNEIEKQMNDLTHKLKEKEIALAELQREKLQSAQIEDQIQHYQAQSHSATTLQQELQNALNKIENLKKENKTLQSKLVTGENLAQEQTIEKNETNPIDAVDATGPEMNETVSSTVNGPVSQDHLEYVEKVNSDEPSDAKTVINDEKNIITITEAMKKLEHRFTETMERVAELTDEKQRLEHLVLQLQGETETIGEYVTLYQKQRAILQEKAREKERTFQQLSEQRNQQQEQLHKLKVLVAELLKSKQSSANVATAAAAEENMPISEGPEENESGDIEVIEGHAEKKENTPSQPDRTTSQILDLLTEIKDCNDTCILEPNFHPCPWCSGKLITV